MIHFPRDSKQILLLNCSPKRGKITQLDFIASIIHGSQEMPNGDVSSPSAQQLPIGDTESF